uniref:Integrin alpha-X-like third Ig-like domain-containing protein n=1 Tax=Chrysemys picta bellii TaxID=8478 RepID=A0A8C3FRZ7_CHRPI
MTPHHHSPAPSITLPPLSFLPSFSSPSLEESTKYVNFSSKEEGTSVPVTHRYEVKNLRQRSVPISVTFQFPVELTPARPLTHPAISFHPQDCSVATCKKIQCRIASLEMQKPLEFTIKGNVSFQWQQKVSLVSEAQIEYEEKKYTQKEGFVQRQVQTVVERSEVYNYLPIIVGSSVGGLVLLALITAALYKVRGCLLSPGGPADQPPPPQLLPPAAISGSTACRRY